MLEVPEIKSRTLKLTNAYLTLHVHSPDTAILNITGIKRRMHAAVWISDDEIQRLIVFLRDYIDSVAGVGR